MKELGGTKKRKVQLCLGLIIVFAGIAFLTNSASGHYQDQANTLDSSQLENGHGEVAFRKMMEVLTHNRCINCHPSGDRPLQGEDSHEHYFSVQRGPDNHGVAALRCESCHQEENNNYSGVPGAPHWGLAPKEMAWEGLSEQEIGAVILNPVTNGNRSLEELVRHMTEDSLVLWAWDPGVGVDGQPREKPPVMKEEFIAAVKEWAAAGAPIPD